MQESRCILPKFVIGRNLPGEGKLSTEELKGISQKSCDVLRELGPQIRMMGNYMIFILLITFMTSGNVHASTHEEKNRCNSKMGKVLKVVNNEFFTIAICDEVKTFTAFSYCWGVNEGDTVIFDWDHHGCEIVSFSVLNNGEQCGVLCPGIRSIK
jgi:hypothetical protein